MNYIFKEVNIMNNLVQARVDPALKTRAAVVLDEMGLSVSDAVRILLTRIARDGRFPLELIPNAMTEETLDKSARGEDVHTVADADDLFRQLGV